VHPADTSRELLLPLSTDAALRHRFLVLHEPIPGNLRFGVLLEELDRLAAMTSMAHVHRTHPGGTVVTAAVDEILVRGVADASHDLVCRARVNRVRRTSMEVGLRVEAAGHGHYATCYFTMVARSGGGPEAASVAVEPIDLTDELDRRRADEALERQVAWRARRVAATEPPSREEFERLSELHAAQEAPGFTGALAAQLGIESWERTFPAQENPSRTIFGGYLMRRAYELASICAERIAPDRPVIAAVNRVNFLHPVQIGDKLRFTSAVVYTEGPAICVRIAIERTSRDRATRALSNSCLFTFVNVDPQMALRDVPAVHPSTYAEDGRWLNARRNLRALQARLQGPWLGLRR
jgi:acyl-CoA hydrolase